MGKAIGVEIEDLGAYRPIVLSQALAGASRK
jgi:hypothetical protein